MSRRPRGDALLLSRLVTASSALLRLAKCPELRAAIDAAQAGMDLADDGFAARWDRWELADADNLLRLANVLSSLAVPDEVSSC